ncbi:MAG TPA: MDR family MFS transporter [Conexibacter sp.]|nr:MDR family MFS transporter [Conexibacter sp.]
MASGSQTDQRAGAARGTGTGATGARDAPLGREVWVVAGVVVLGVFMSILDTTIVNVALDTLARELHAPLDTIQWVATGYLLSLAIVIPLSGWFSERFGSKRVWMSSVAIFGLGSALCGAAWSSSSLIAFRVVQGIGGGMIMPVGMSLLAQTAGPRRVGRVLAVIGVPMLLAPVFGPVIGGLIVDTVSWRWIFYVNVPVVALALVLAARLLHGDQGRADAGRLDWVGVALLPPGLALIVFGLSEVEAHGGIGAPIAFGPIVLGLVLLALFARHAWGAARPLVDVRLFAHRCFRPAAVSITLAGAMLFGSILVLALYYQVARGESALDTGLLLAPQGLGAAAVMPIAGRLTDRIGGGHVAAVGFSLLTLGTLPFAFVGADTSYALLTVALVVRGIGLGCAMMPTMAAAFAQLEPPQVPRATATLNALQRTGGSIGTALLAVVLTHELTSALVGIGPAGGGSTSVGEVPPAVRARAAEPLASAFGTTFRWAVAISAVAIVPATVLALRERGAHARAAAVAPPA